MNFNRSSFKLFFNFLSIIALEIFFLTFVILKFDSASSFIFLILILFTFYVFLDAKSDELRIVILVGLSLVSPMVSYPIDSSENIISSILENISSDNQRFQIRSFIIAFFSLLFFLKILLFNYRKKSRVVTLILIILSLLGANILSFNYMEYSMYDGIIDLSFFIGSGAIIIYFRSSYKSINIKLEEIFNYSKVILFIFISYVLLDTFISLLRFVPWSISYRNGIQGTLTGMEMPFSFILGLTFTVLYVSNKNYFLKFFILLLATIIIPQTNITSALTSFILTILVIYFKKRNIINIYSFSLLFLFCAIVFISQISIFYEIDSLRSGLARLGTYLAIADIFTNINIFSGIMPGVIDVQSTNLSRKVFELVSSQFLSNLPTAIGGELLERSNYIVGGGFIPHNSGLALIASHGLFIVYPVFYFFYFFPLNIIISSNFVLNKNSNILFCIIIFSFLFSFFHPMIMVFLVVSTSEVLRLYKINSTKVGLI